MASASNLLLSKRSLKGLVATLTSLQRWGHEAWGLAKDSPITLQVVLNATDRAIAQLKLAIMECLLAQCYKGGARTLSDPHTRKVSNDGSTIKTGDPLEDRPLVECLVTRIRSDPDLRAFNQANKHR